MATIHSVRVVRVIDGDTVRLRYLQDQSGEEINVRLYGIDAPEAGQPYSRIATDALALLVKLPGELLLEVHHTDPYGRPVGLLYYAENGRQYSLNRQMLYHGHAHAYILYGGEELGFRRIEGDAKRRRAGLWRNHRNRQGLDRPWHHRQEMRGTKQKAVTPANPAKSADTQPVQTDTAHQRRRGDWVGAAAVGFTVAVILLAALVAVMFSWGG